MTALFTQADRLLELAERVEKATGPDRELDALIWAELDGRDVRWSHNKLLARSRRAPHDECWLGTIDLGKVARNFSLLRDQSPIPAYTASLDAAMTLVPQETNAIDDCHWQINTLRGTTMPEGGFHAAVYAAGGWLHSRSSKTPALALTAAAIRARASLPDAAEGRG